MINKTMLAGYLARHFLWQCSKLIFKNINEKILQSLKIAAEEVDELPLLNIVSNALKIVRLN
jgi:hypothetical protein